MALVRLFFLVFFFFFVIFWHAVSVALYVVARSPESVGARALPTCRVETGNPNPIYIYIYMYVYIYIYIY